MANNEDLFELMTKMYNLMQDEFGKVRNEMKNEFGEVRNEIQDVRSEMLDGFDGVNKRFDRLENKLDDMEANNADRHLDFVEELNALRDSVGRAEEGTAENWKDIARLKRKIDL